MLHLHIHSGEVKISGRLSEYSDEEIYNLVKARADRNGIDTFERESPATSYDIERYSKNPIIEVGLTYPCQNIAFVRWAELIEEQE